MGEFQLFVFSLFSSLFSSIAFVYEEATGCINEYIATINEATIGAIITSANQRF